MSDEMYSPQEETRIASGAGIKRRRIEFVRANVETESNDTQVLSHPIISAGDRYLSIVLKSGGSTKELETTDTKIPGVSSESHTKQVPVPKAVLCDICKLPRSVPDDDTATSAIPHEASIAHLVCTKHSYPPSHLDRNRQGLKYLSSYGWDPDSRLGLGAAGEGIRAPIKAKAKNDTVGLGVKLKDFKHLQQKKVESLNAKQAKRKDSEDRKRRERLQEIFYRNSDVEKYLGGA
jgi:hypothetical protein